MVSETTQEDGRIYMTKILPKLIGVSVWLILYRKFKFKISPKEKAFVKWGFGFFSFQTSAERCMHFLHFIIKRSWRKLSRFSFSCLKFVYLLDLPGGRTHLVKAPVQKFMLVRYVSLFKVKEDLNLTWNTQFVQHKNWIPNTAWIQNHKGCNLI